MSRFTLSIKCFPHASDQVSGRKSSLKEDGYIRLLSVGCGKSPIRSHSGQEKIYLAYISRSQLITDDSQGKTTNGKWKETVEKWCCFAHFSIS